MNVNIDTISLVILLISVLIWGSRQVTQLKSFKSPQILIVLYYLCLLIIVLCEAALVFDSLTFIRFELVYKTALTTIYSVLLTLISFVCIKDMTPKKVKILWRIPFIGFFAGSYFELNYISFICAAYLGICFIMLWREKLRYRFLIKKLLFILPATIGIFFLKINMLSYLNIMLLWLVIFCSPILTISNVSSLLGTKGRFE
jgi:hypothetical protein